ncbi:MAG: FecR family protein [Pseudobacter sp.]|uniref:FecR family protein n=1 Tax=Pseudobacter sp. TaxID=2045420 RepID=UPI003F814AB5
MATPQHILHIIQKRLSRQELTEQERSALEQWFSAAEREGHFMSEGHWEQGLAEYQAFVSDKNKNDKALLQFMQAAGFRDQRIPDHETVSASSDDTGSGNYTHRVHFLRRWGGWAAAAVLIIGTITAILLTKNKPISDPQPLSQTTDSSNIIPFREKAVLTLADGSMITLDSAANGAIARQGNASIIKLADGAVRYDVKDNQQSEALLNTISTPKGGQYQVSLPDGSKVWLNAASSIRFPAAFGAERTVTVTGEVYLEVARNKSKPFIVHANGMQVEVLGTSFNVNVYADEPSSKVTLVEGSINVNNTRLQPGQALMNGKIITADLEQDLAWKNGAFNLNNKTLPELMRQIGRWYDLEIIYEGAVQTRTFEGEIGMNLSLAQCIRALDRMQIHCRLEGRKLTVLP